MALAHFAVIFSDTKAFGNSTNHISNKKLRKQPGLQKLFPGASAGRSAASTAPQCAAPGAPHSIESAGTRSQRQSKRTSVTTAALLQQAASLVLVHLY